MQQPFAHKVSVPPTGGGGASGNDATLQGFVGKKEGSKVEKRWLVGGSTIDWFDEAKTGKKGTLKCDSIMSLDRNGLEISISTATKSHVFCFENQVLYKLFLLYSFFLSCTDF